LPHLPFHFPQVPKPVKVGIFAFAAFVLFVYAAGMVMAGAPAKVSPINYVWFYVLPWAGLISVFVWGTFLFFWVRVVPYASKYMYRLKRKGLALAIVVADTSRSAFAMIVERRGEGIVVTGEDKYKLLPRYTVLPTEEEKRQKRKEEGSKKRLGEDTAEEGTESGESSPPDPPQETITEKDPEVPLNYADYSIKRSFLADVGSVPFFVAYHGSICLFDPLLLALAESCEMKESIPRKEADSQENKMPKALPSEIVNFPSAMSLKKVREFIKNVFEETQYKAIIDEIELSLRAVNVKKWLKWIVVAAAAASGSMMVYMMRNYIAVFLMAFPLPFILWYFMMPILSVMTVFGMMAIAGVWFIAMPKASRTFFWAKIRGWIPMFLSTDTGKNELCLIKGRDQEDKSVLDTNIGKFKLLPRYEELQDGKICKDHYSDLNCKRNILSGVGFTYIAYTGQLCLFDPEVKSLVSKGKMKIRTAEGFVPENDRADFLQPLMLLEPRKIKGMVSKYFDATDLDATRKEIETLVSEERNWMRLILFGGIALLAIFGILYFMPTLQKMFMMFGGI
jgi:hypothetical protein